MNRQEWYDHCIERGTRGDMVFDILRDWGAVESHAVNTHDGLITACKEAVYDHKYNGALDNATFDKLLAALALAIGGAP